MDGYTSKHSLQSSTYGRDQEWVLACSSHPLLTRSKKCFFRGSTTPPLLVRGGFSFCS